ncbi:MAG: hypothetical protein P8Z80_08150 [Pseudolabrys sp.]
MVVRLHRAEDALAHAAVDLRIRAERDFGRAVIARVEIAAGVDERPGGIVHGFADRAVGVHVEQQVESMAFIQCTPQSLPA